MAEITALRKHPCPECGGDAEWNPGKQALVCPYCGTTVPWTEGESVLGETIREHDLVEALRSVPDSDRGWHAEKRSVKCQSCHAISVFDADKAAKRCDFCGSPSIVPFDEGKDAITPESVLPFRLSEPQVRDALRAWYGSRWFAPNRFKNAALTDTLHGIYLPYWTFDAHVQAQWTAESGYYYYETETYRDAQGNTQQRQVQRTRWQPSAGELEHFFDDSLVAGTVGVRPDLLAKIGGFPTGELKGYDPAYVRGWTVERYQVDLRQASVTNMEAMERTVYSMCGSQVPGDTHRNLRVDSRYDGRTFKHILVPVWLVTYTYGPKSFQIVVNGISGQIAGERPISWVKVFFGVILPILIVLILILAGQR